jgi:DNA-binding NtrC family response regulator
MRRMWLRVLAGPDSGQRIGAEGDRVVIGTHEKADVRLSDGAVSRFHCEIRVEGEVVMLRDLGSRNGTFLDGVLIREAYLSENGMISVGTTQLRFEVGDDRVTVALSAKTRFGAMVGQSRAMRRVFAILEKAAHSDATVLVTGETGTGKSLLARAVHSCSSRRDGAFVEVNCGALPSGLLEAELFGHAKGAFTGAEGARVGRFEVADGGTLFLDEIDSAPPDLQVKLLRVLQERQFERVGESQTRTVDVRVFAATNAALQQRVADGTFREDLYWRLAVVSVRVPALRERPRALVPLALSFLKRFALEYGKSVTGIRSESLALLAKHDWPGNVRQLEHAVERAVLLARGPELVPDDFSAELQQRAALRPETSLAGGLEWLSGATRLPSLREALEEPERRIVVRALELAGGRRDRAAEMLVINRSTLFNKMRKYGLLDRSFDDKSI